MYTSLGHSLLLAMNNDTCVKSSMAPQAYKFVSTHAHEISGWTILSRLLYSRAPHLGGINVRNGEQLEDFHSRIIRLQQEIMLSGEIFSPTILLIQYMKALTKSEKLKAFMAPKMTDLITFIDKNGKSTAYDGEYIHGIYRYLEMIGAPTALTTLHQDLYRHGFLK